MTAIPLLLALIVPSEAPPLGDAHRVLILGDSITAAGRYTAYIESYFATRFPDREIEFINLGLPSETVSGLSEPTHPWPRPSVHERLERALTRIKPDVVMACYGMNDGIYAPFSEARLAKYQDAYLKLVSRCREDGIRTFVVTPPPFDAEPIRSTVQPLGAAKYGWTGPYANYEDDVLKRYAAWLTTLNGVGFSAIDTHTPIRAHLAKAQAKEKGYRLAGDGVHLDSSGQWLIAQAILAAWNVSAIVDTAAIDAKSLTVERGEVSALKSESGGVRFSWVSRIPMPHDPDWNATLVKREGIDARLNQYQLTITGLDRDRYSIYEGDHVVGQATRDELTKGVDLLKLAELSTNRRSAELGELVRRRERLMSPAWLDFVGHKRPDTAKGLPLNEAKKQAGPITASIKRLARPVALEFRIIPD
ncbi:MAG: hypothetical protein JWN86_1623 [Planctomycetota bacterium]|nr:hypothetical protein [Planctomycetota bacterium]